MNRGAIVEETTVVGGQAARYLAAGEGPPLVLLHAPAVAGFLDALAIERAAIVGNSLGGLVALRLALSNPACVSALCLVDIAGLGRTVSYALRAPTLPGYGEVAIAWTKRPPGGAGRAWMRANLLFARPHLVPAEWLAEQRRLARRRGFLEAALAALRAQIAPGGQREVLLEDLPSLTMPTLVIWGARQGLPEAPGPDRGRPAQGEEPGLYTRLRPPAPGRASGPLRSRPQPVPRRKGKPLARNAARSGAQVLRI